ncbi:hypothetical protein KEM63_15825 [Halopseudomonas nanhaiensis]|uniref:hypothetical protein n=1 Tax=Halopseudomonas nanhaiensis TaxID=2830842 RepID=UPI001CC131EF|nr:hypothetical protein [Halopseudomonas nanhaiensis]UAW98216.1 hypothetical protein KEM63_15825 [Halopseudomonas nanhaiensis]
MTGIQINRKSLRRWCLGILCGLIPVVPSVAETASPEATAREPLNWTVWPLPGVVNVRDGQPTDGATMDMLRLVMSKLPAFEAQYRLGNRFRQQQEMQQGQDFCSTPLFRRADTDEYAYFIPFMASTPIQMVIRRSAAADFPIEDGAISLAALAERDDLRGGYSGFRTYPPVISSWLEQARRDDRIERATGTPSGENLLRMVSLERIDYAFEFSILINTVNKRLRNGEALRGVPIKGHGALIDAGIYCSRTPWGKRVAGELDRVIRELASDPETFLALYRPWVPEDTYALYQHDLRAYYRQRASRTTPID